MGLPKILLTVPRLNMGGAESYTATLALQLHKRGYPVVLASGGGALARMLAPYGISHHWVPFRASIPLSSLLLEAIIKKEHIDIVHANSSVAGDATSFACAKSKTPWIITSHGYGVNFPSSYSAFRVICVSDFVRRAVVHKAPDINDRMLATIYNGVDLHRLMNGGKSFRALCNIPAGSFCLGIVSRLNAKIWRRNKKGHQDLFAILATHPAATDWHLLVAGGGSGLPKARRRVQQLGIQDRVHLLGQILDIPSMLNEIDVFAFPSYAETFGLVIAEAMAASKAVVAYDVGGVPEVIADDTTGYLVPRGDIQAFAERLTRLATDRNQAIAMGKLGHQRAEELFSLEKMTDKILEIYHSALAGADV
ncbi:MAG TPA: glycosyltransferase family 4 protein [Armatimonadota bacterium]|nr:glycosyltransferase family 4 protein [Armatimonadota bacterium]